MRAETAAQPKQRLTIQSRLDDLGLVWPWVESIAAKHSVPSDTLFAIHLCLEEVVSNVIRHGYSQPDRPISVDFSTEPGALAFVIEDEAPPFDPLASTAIEAAPAPASIDQLPLGGRGIPLLRKFAGSLSYERLARSNRLTIRFPVSR